MFAILYQALNAVLSLADGTTIMNIVKSFAPGVQHGLKTLVDKKPAFAAVGFTGETKRNLVALGAHSDGFCSALIGKAPVSHSFRLRT